MKGEASAYCQSLIASNITVPCAFTLFQSDWHQGVIGIIASRMKDEFYRPTFAFAQGDQGQLKGSGRSIKGFHLRESLDRLNASHPALIIKFGGHAMAAGLTILASQLTQFTALFQQDVNENIDPLILTNKIVSDGELTAESSR